MTTRNFDALFEPGSIALIGASNRERSVGSVLARNLLETGFRGPIMTVNPHETAIRSTVNYRSVAALPIVPDLAVIATPPETVPGLISELGKRGCRAAIVITAGFEEAQSALRQRMLDAARPHLLRIVGPNCLGFISPAKGINATFAHLTPKRGDIAFVTQSGAVATTILDWAMERDIGFSHVVSLGDMSDIDFGDMLDYLALDPATHSILLYVETITHARKFMSAARIAARAKPVIVVKAGRSQAGAKAALSHTGALAGSDAVYDAAFRRAGILRVTDLRDLFDAAETLATGIRIGGDRLTILTNGGGLGVLAADALESQGGRLAELSPATFEKLGAILPKTWSRRNPIDILGDASGERYRQTLEVLSASTDHDAILVMNCPTGVSDGLEIADAVLQVAHEHPLPMLTCWVGQASASEARRRFSTRGLPTYETPDEATRAFMQLVDFRRNQELLLETPPARVSLATTEKRSAQSIIAKVRHEKRSVLTAPEAKSVLSAYDIPVVSTLIAKDASQAAECAKEIAGSVALKILSPDITHKSDVGGVRLALRPSEVESAARDMLQEVQSKLPATQIEGFTIEPMVDSAKAHEIILGMSVDPTFGPVLLVGAGGVAVEALGDRAMGLPPLNLVLAREMIARTRIAKLLKGYRDVPPADEEALALTLVKLSELVVERTEIVELDINPLVVSAKGVIALDARIVIGARDAESLAICPYPAELERDCILPGGEKVHLRPIRPEDEPALNAMVARSSSEDRGFRFHHGMKELTHAMAARFSQIDYDREMAFIATPQGKDKEILAVARLVSDPNYETGEFAVMVRTDMKGLGLGYRLMQELLAYARTRGIERVFGLVMSSNTTMLELARELGASIETEHGGDVVRVVFTLAKEAPAPPTSSKPGFRAKWPPRTDLSQIIV